jgi:hypothetical protein
MRKLSGQPWKREVHPTYYVLWLEELWRSTPEVKKSQMSGYHPKYSHLIWLMKIRSDGWGDTVITWCRPFSLVLSLVVHW